MLCTSGQKRENEYPQKSKGYYDPQVKTLYGIWDGEANQLIPHFIISLLFLSGFKREEWAFEEKLLVRIVLPCGLRTIQQNISTSFNEVKKKFSKSHIRNGQPWLTVYFISIHTCQPSGKFWNFGLPNNMATFCWMVQSPHGRTVLYICNCSQGL